MVENKVMDGRRYTLKTDRVVLGSLIVIGEYSIEEYM